MLGLRCIGNRKNDGQMQQLHDLVVSLCSSARTDGQSEESSASMCVLRSMHSHGEKAW